jgi:hypothetical protein
MDNEDEDNVMSLESFFICEEYIVKTFTFGDLSQSLLCSNMSSTDPDLTGQIVWPAAILLSYFIYHIRDSLESITMLELGAGCGLGGFVSANYSNKVIITDGNEVVMRLLDRNNEFLHLDHVYTRKLIWADPHHIRSVIDDFGPIDVIIGADVILWPQHIEELLLTIRVFLSSRPK